ncbi:MAG: rRNA maturation RNase YbeY [Cyanobacteria bacterium P01_H01_bin.121]
MSPAIAFELAVQTQWQPPHDLNQALPTLSQWQHWFTTWARLLQPTVPALWQATPAWELCLQLLSDEQMRALNAQYRQQDRATDVLAFATLEAEPLPGLPSEAEPSLYIGDLAIAIPTAQRQAYALGHSLTVELAWLASHGLLHLLGWDHPDELSLAAMLQQQSHLLTHVCLIPPDFGQAWLNDG